MAEVAIPRQMFQEILRLNAELREKLSKRWKAMNGRHMPARVFYDCIPLPRGLDRYGGRDGDFVPPFGCFVTRL
jgi:hypothetical protein